MLKDRSARLLGLFLRAFFHLLYHQFAWSYDLVAASVSLGRWKTWVYAALPFLPGPRVLELGHGPGHLQAALRSKGVESAGLDESRQMSRIASKRLVEIGFTPWLVSAYAQSAPFPDACFDQIAATFPTEYIYEAITLTEIKRLLRPQGALVIVPLAWITGASIPDRVARWLFLSTRQAPADSGMETIRRLIEPLHAGGFEVTEQRINVASSQVLVLVATPIPPPPAGNLQ